MGPKSTERWDLGSGTSTGEAEVASSDTGTEGLAPARSVVSPTSGPSGRLYNADLALTLVEARNWRAYNIFALWAVDVHSLGNYGFAFGLFALLGAWQILTALGTGVMVLFVLIALASVAGWVLWQTGGNVARSASEPLTGRSSGYASCPVPRCGQPFTARSSSISATSPGTPSARGRSAEVASGASCPTPYASGRSSS